MVDRTADTITDGHPMVELRQVSKRYGDATAVSAIDLVVAKGEFVTLLGPSGSGKTTLLNLIAGMLQPTTGQIFIDGRDATSLAPSQRGLGMVFQNYALMPHMTVFDNIAFPLKVRKLPKAEIESKVHDVLRLIRLPDVAGRKPRELSGGQQQRIALARCIVYNPSLILLDEPLGALDKKLREQMQLEIKRIHNELHITMLNVTHDQEEALTLSDRIVLMNGGRIEQQCGPEELYFHPETVFAADFIGNANLFEAEVTARLGDRLELTTEGRRIEAAVPSRPPAVGDAVTLLVRPENLRFAVNHDGPNVLQGTLHDSIVLGGSVKHQIALVSGKLVMLQEPNHARRLHRARGQTVDLCWDLQDSVVLREGTAP